MKIKEGTVKDKRGKGRRWKKSKESKKEEVRTEKQGRRKRGSTSSAHFRVYAWYQFEGVKVQEKSTHKDLEKPQIKQQTKTN